MLIQFSKIFISLLLLTLHVKLHGQELFFEPIKHKGIYQDGIFDISQDKNGFLWLATHKGLVRYDGIRTVAYEHFFDKEKITPCDKIFELKIDKNNHILAITSEGLCKLDQSKNKFYKIPHPSINEYSSLCETNMNDILITTPDGILCLSENDKIKEVVVANHDFFPYQNSIKKIYHIADSMYFVTASNGGIGVAKYDHERNIFKLVSYSKKASTCRAIGKESNSIYWFGFQNNIQRMQLLKTGELKTLDILSAQAKEYKEMDNITDMIVSSNKNIYVTTATKGLFEINSNTYTAKRYLQNDKKNSLKWNTILCLFEDNTSVIWIGKGQGGITKIDTQRKPFYNIKHDPLHKKSLSHDYINPILIDSKGHLWAGTLEGELNRSIQKFGETEVSKFEFEHIYKKQIMRYALFELDKYVIIGAGANILFFNLDSEQFSTLPLNSRLKTYIRNHHIFNFEIDNENRLWIGGSNSLLCVDFDNDIQNLLSGNCVRVPIKTNNGISINERVNQILSLDSLGTFIAMNNGLFTTVKNKNKDTILLHHYFNQPDQEMSLSHSRVTSICKDQQNQIWIGTYNGGLNKVIFNNGDIVGFHNKKNKINLPNSSVFDIQSDDQNKLWIASNNGIIKYNPQNNSYIQYTYFLSEDISKFNINGGGKTKDGQLLFAGNNGIIAFYPNDIKLNNITAKVALTELLISHNPVSVGEKICGRIILPNSLETLNQITIPHACNNFTIQFSALHYSYPQNNSFKYKLKGLDDEWQYTTATQNYVHYPKLPHGNYTFLLKAINSDMIESSEVRALHIRILPPWYSTWLARIIFCLLFCGLLWTVFIYLHKLSHLKQSLKLESIAKQQEKALFEMKQRFFTNISHELKTPLSLIIGPVEGMIADAKRKKFDSKTLSLVLKNALRLQRLINQILDFRRLEQNKMKVNLQKADMIELIQDVLTACEYGFNEAKLKVSFINNIEKTEFWFDYDKIEKVLYNLISNVCKYSKKGGEVVIETSIDQQTDLFVFSILNEGNGVPPSKKQRIFDRFYQLEKQSSGTGIGLAMTKDFIELHKGNIQEKGKFGENSLFVFTLPLNLSHFTFQHNEDQYPKPQIAISNHNDSTICKNQRASILLVEDNLDMLEFISDIFLNHFHVIKAINGNEGIDLANKHIPDIIVSDVMMPEMDGYDLCKRLKEEAKTCHIPFIMLTAKDTLDEKIEGISIGADAYITKPFRADHLIAQIQNLLNSRQKLQKAYKEKYAFITDNVKTTSQDDLLMKKFIQFIDKHISNSELKVEDVAQELAYSYMQFNRKIKALTGESVGQFINQYRLKKAKLIFENNPTVRVSDVMAETGFNTHSHFSKLFKQQFGLTPKEYREHLLN